MERVSCAIVGYGGIAEFHAEALKQIEGVELHTLMGRRAEPAKDFADRHGFGRTTTSLEEALARAGDEPASGEGENGGETDARLEDGIWFRYGYEGKQPLTG